MMISTLSSRIRLALKLVATIAMMTCTASQAAGTQEPGVYSFCSGWEEKATAQSSDFLRYYPGLNNWLFNTGDFTPLQSPSDESIASLKRVVAALAGRGIKTVIVVPPVRGLMASNSVGPLRERYGPTSDDAIRRSYHTAIAKLARTGAIVPDVLDSVDAAKLPSSFPFYRMQDPHWRAEGARLVARIVADTVKKSVDLSAFPAKRYVSRLVGQETYMSHVTDAIESICGKKFVRELEPRYVTEVADDGPAGADLLGGGGAPVVLVGTSFSRPDAAYNFAGFLSEYLGVDLLNAAIAGGGLETSILSYLSSKDFTESPPAVLIWEIRPFDIPPAAFSDQVLATITGSCATDKVMLSTSVQLKRGITPLVTVDAKLRERLTVPTYIDIAAGDTGINKYTLRLSYSDFSEQDIEIDMTRAAFAPEHYFHALPVQRMKTLESISLRPAARSSGKVTVSLCPISRAS